MTKTSKIIIAFVIVAVLILGIAYAAIQNVTLHITGTATAGASQENFTVKFSGTPEVSDSDKVTAAVTDDINATINVSGLSSKGEVVTARYTIQNTSADLSANLSATLSNSNTEFFNVTYDFESESITSAEATTITVTVELLKTPIEESVSSTVGIQIVAEPVQPQ